MARPALLELCLLSDSALEGILLQLRCSNNCLSLSRPLHLDADGQALQLSVQDLAAAVERLVREGEENLAQAARKASLQDEVPSEAPSTKGAVKERGDGDHEHGLANPYTSSPFSTTRPSSTTCDNANPEPGKLDLDSFPSLGSTRQQKTKAPPEALMRLVSQSPLPSSAAFASASNRGSSKRRVAPTPVQQVVRDATFVKATEGREKARSGRKVTPTSVDKPIVNRSFVAAAGAASPGQSPAGGQLSASTAPNSAQPGRSWPSFSNQPGLPSPATMPASAPASSNIQPSPLLGRAGSVSAVRQGDELSISSGAAKQHSIEHRLRDMHVVSGASDCATAGSNSWTQHTHSLSHGAAGPGSSGSAWAQRPSQSAAVPGSPWGPGQSGSGAQQSSAGQDSLERGFGALHALSEASDCATAGSSPWGQHTPRPSAGSALPGSPWGWAKAGHAASGPPLSSAASNIPQTGGASVSRSIVPSAATPGSRATAAPAATPGSAVSVTSRFKPCEQQGANAGTDFTSPPPEAPICLQQQADTVSGAHQEPGSGVAGPQSPASNPSLNICGEAGAVVYLPDRARRAAALQSALIQHTAAAPLAAELDSLIRLLATPCAAADEAGTGQSTLFPSGRAAAQYACAVLSNIGALGAALPLPLLEALASNASLIEHAPGLAHSLEESLLQRQSAAAHLGAAQLSASSAFAVHAFTSDGQPRRSKEEQRLVSNREGTRDAWFQLLREASSAASRGGRSQRNAFGSSHVLQDAGEEAAAFEVLAEGAPRLVRGIEDANLLAFARLFTAVALQAAAAGEALLDQELTDLAQRNPAKFSRLNQRLQGHGASAKGAGKPAKHGSAAGSAASGRGVGPRVKQRGGRETGWDSLAASSLEAAARFPPAQRLLVLFLEAADSHRLNRALSRCMRQRLSSLHAEVVSTRRGHTPQRCEQAIDMAALACFVAYITAGEEAGEYAASFMPRALETAIREGALVWTLPWVASYAATSSAKFSCSLPESLLAQLAVMRHSSLLRPGHGEFRLPALCMRGALDELAQHVPLMSAGDSTAMDEAAEEEAVRLSVAVEGELDERFVQLCCPQLNQALQAGVSGAPKEAPRRGLRKIRPTVPVPSSGWGPAAAVPDALSALAAGEQDAAKQALQSTFLAMYSNSETKVRLNSVVDYITEILSHTVRERCLRETVAAACAVAAVTLREGAAEHLQESGAAVTADALRLHLQGAVPHLQADASSKAMQAAGSMAVTQAECAAAQALKALAHPSWTPAVVATAAAMAADRATSACARSFIEQVPSEVAAMLRLRVDEIVAETLKTFRRRQQLS